MTTTDAQVTAAFESLPFGAAARFTYPGPDEGWTMERVVANLSKLNPVLADAADHIQACEDAAREWESEHGIGGAGDRFTELLYPDELVGAPVDGLGPF